MTPTFKPRQMLTTTATLAADKSQEVRVDRVGVGGKHAMREAGVELQSGVLEELDLEQSSALVRNDLVIVPLHDERWHVDALQVLSEVRFRKRLDTVVMGFGPAHHALAPPVLDDAIQPLRTRPVEPIERVGSD